MYTDSDGLKQVVIYLVLKINKINNFFGTYKHKNGYYIQIAHLLIHLIVFV